MSEARSEPAVVQQLCAEIAAEENPNKVNHLVESLRKSVEIEREEARLRLRLIAQQYRERIRSAPLRTTMFDVLSFLGLVSSHAGGEANVRSEKSKDVVLNEGDREKSETS